MHALGTDRHVRHAFNKMAYVRAACIRVIVNRLKRSMHCASERCSFSRSLSDRFQLVLRASTPLRCRPSAQSISACMRVKGGPRSPPRQSHGTYLRIWAIQGSNNLARSCCFFFNKIFINMSIYTFMQRMWLDKATGAKCYTLSARALNISWGDTHMYWRWIHVDILHDIKTGKRSRLSIKRSICKM
jgi:hypothetical protein